jgi:G3E family GTPase
MPNEGEEYTPEEWVAEFLKATPEKRLEVAGIMLVGHRRGMRCWMEGHRHQIEGSYRQGWQDALKTVQTELEKEK